MNFEKANKLYKFKKVNEKIYSNWWRWKICQTIKRKFKSKNFIFLNKKKLNILNRKQIEKKLKNINLME